MLNESQTKTNELTTMAEIYHSEFLTPCRIATNTIYKHLSFHNYNGSLGNFHDKKFHDNADSSPESWLVANELGEAWDEPTKPSHPTPQS